MKWRQAARTQGAGAREGRVHLPGAGREFPRGAQPVRVRRHGGERRGVVRGRRGARREFAERAELGAVRGQVAPLLYQDGNYTVGLGEGVDWIVPVA